MIYFDKQKKKWRKFSLSLTLSIFITKIGGGEFDRLRET